MPQPIPIVADIPTDRPGLGFGEYVDALADAIRGGEPAQFTIGLYGAWGSGKTSLLKAIARNLAESDGTDVLPVFFDAWRYERADHIVLPLLFSVSEAARREGDEALTTHLRRALQALVFSLNFQVGPVSLDTKAVHDEWMRQQSDALDDAFARPFEELRSLPRTLGDRRVAVLIDDLDRCSPDKVVALLEAINLVMDIDGFIFVLALDYEVLVRAVATRYPHVSGHEFIEKMVQLPFRVPPLTIGSSGVLADLIPQWRTRQRAFPASFGDSVVAVARSGCESNPRQIKRLINSVLLIQRIVEHRGLSIDMRLLAAMIGLQLRWPDEFDDVQDAVLAGASEPFAALRANEDQALGRYAGTFFERAHSNDVLRQVLQLTAVVAADHQRDTDRRPVREIRAEMREELVAGLPQRGFLAKAGGDTVWYRKEPRDIRVVLTKIGFRIELPTPAEFGGEGWTLYFSLDYRSAREGLAWLEQGVGRPVPAGSYVPGNFKNLPGISGPKS